MGSFQSMFGISQTFTAQDFEDVSQKPELMAKFNSIDNHALRNALLLCEFGSLKEKFVDYVLNHLDIEKLKSGHHSDKWSKDLEIPEDPLQKRSTIREVIDNIFEVCDKDKDLGYYVKRILSNLTNSELGGFIIDDQREVKDTKTLQYLQTRKSILMRRYLSRIKKVGFVFCPEHDQTEIHGISGLKSYRLDPAVHTGNMAKVIYHHESLSIIELAPAVVIARMTEKKLATTDYEKYQDRFAVVHIQGPTGCLAENGIHAICCHLKSVGNKKDITEKNLAEYAFIKTVVQSFDGDLLLLGDFNCPGSFEEAVSHFRLEDKHRLNYPLQEDGTDSPYNMTFGLTRFGTYQQSDIAGKRRSPDCAFNCQATRGKFGDRFYYTDGVWGRFAKKVSAESQLYPLPREGETLLLPRLDGTDEGDWFSDHQAIETTIGDFHIGVCNTLSDCASDEQPFLEKLSGEEVDIARQLLNEHLAEFVSDIVDAEDAMEDTDDEMDTETDN